MTRLLQMDRYTLARTLVLCAPALLLGACAAPAEPPPCDACAVAHQAEATANHALEVAQQALTAADAARAAASEMYQRGLRK